VSESVEIVPFSFSFLQEQQLFRAVVPENQLLNILSFFIDLKHTSSCLFRLCLFFKLLFLQEKSSSHH
jgi:hypothetical protein